MKFFGHEFGHKNPPAGTAVQNPEGDREAEAASEAAFAKSEFAAKPDEAAQKAAEVAVTATTQVEESAPSETPQEGTVTELPSVAPEAPAQAEAPVEGETPPSEQTPAA